jgi:REP element-mobilizing transposase RayT
MGEPPRLRQILLPGEKSIIYFVTLCVDERRHVLANPQLFKTIRETTGQLRDWQVIAGVVMPDHIHFVITPRENRSLSVSDFSTGFKRLLGKQLGHQTWQWQRGCFDRLLRSDENLHNKWIYIEDNPVRADLVTRVEDWPYYLGSIAEQSVGEAVSLPTSKAGKLTASPTERMRNPGKLTASPTDQWS